MIVVSFDFLCHLMKHFSVIDEVHGESRKKLETNDRRNTWRLSDRATLQELILLKAKIKC